jgi:hypothetical protein
MRNRLAMLAVLAIAPVVAAQEPAEAQDTNARRARESLNTLEQCWHGCEPGLSLNRLDNA